MPSISLCLRLAIPLACVLIAYGGFHAYLTVRTQRDEIFAGRVVQHGVVQRTPRAS